MNTKQIDYALELAQVKNFNRAAENLFIFQPSLSYQIQALESEIGLALFLRSGRGAEVTPAGEQFFQTLRNIREELKAAIEQGQNFSARYRSAVMIALPMRSCLYYLPEAMKAFEKTHPDVTVMPHFFPFSDFSSFLKGEEDLIFAMAGDAKGIPDVHSYPLFDSRIYLITKKDDPLAGKDIVRPEDLRGRTLMVGGGSPPPLRRVQKRMIEEVGVDFFTSHDHETTLTNVAAGRGVCLAPGFLDDHNGEFAKKYGSAMYRLFNADAPASMLVGKYRAPIYTLTIDYGDDPKIVGDAAALFLGSVHGIWIPCVTGRATSTTADFPIHAFDNPGFQDMKRMIQQYIGNFMRTGNPNGNGLPEWQKWMTAKDGFGSLVIHTGGNTAAAGQITAHETYEDVIRALEADDSIDPEAKDIIIHHVLSGRWWSGPIDRHFSHKEN